MLDFFKNLLGTGPRLNVEELLSKGAIIIDVRTETEFRAGHIEGSINIPLNKLPKNISKLKKNKPIITCCASGVRSSTAKNILINNGFAEVYNGGSWWRLSQKLNKRMIRTESPFAFRIQFSYLQSSLPLLFHHWHSQFTSPGLSGLLLLLLLLFIAAGVFRIFPCLSPRKLRVNLKWGVSHHYKIILNNCGFACGKENSS